MGKVAVLTGGTGGLGPAVAQRLSDDGFELHLSAMDDADAARYSGPGEIRTVSLTDLDDTRRWAEGIAGDIHALVCVAGGFSMVELHSAKRDDFDKMIDVNLRTSVNTLAAFGLRLAHGSSVVLFGAQAYTGAAGMSIYAASKAAVVSLMKGAAQEWNDRRIRVNALLPNIIDTPANRKAMPNANYESWMKPEEVASVVSFLVSKESSVVNGNAIAIGRTL